MAVLYRERFVTPHTAQWDVLHQNIIIIIIIIIIIFIVSFMQGIYKLCP